MEKNKNNIINKNKRSTQVVIVDKFEDNPQLEGKEMQFHKKPGPIRPPRPNNPPIWFTNWSKAFEQRINSRFEKIESRLSNVEDVLKRNNLH